VLTTAMFVAGYQLRQLPQQSWNMRQPGNTLPFWHWPCAKQTFRGNDVLLDSCGV